MPEREDALRIQRLTLAGTIGFAMAQKAVDILVRYLDWEQLTRARSHGSASFDCEIPAPDGAVFGAILETVSNCLGASDDRPLDECRRDALLQVVDLAALASGVRRQAVLGDVDLSAGADIDLHIAYQAPPS